MFERKKNLQGAYVGGDIVKATKRAHPHVHWRHDITQSEKATGTDELNFDPDVIGPLIEGGKNDAKHAIRAIAAEET